MIDIEKIKSEIVEKLKPLNPDKIILFGSYAYGTPNQDSDIDLFLVKNDLTLDKVKDFEFLVYCFGTLLCPVAPFPGALSTLFAVVWIWPFVCLNNYDWFPV